MLRLVQKYKLKLILNSKDCGLETVKVYTAMDFSNLNNFKILDNGLIEVGVGMTV